jgi:hypothetical protein
MIVVAPQLYVYFISEKIKIRIFKKEIFYSLYTRKITILPRDAIIK